VALIRVELAHALPHVQRLVALELPSGATVREALNASGLLKRVPAAERARLRYGIYGGPAGLERRLRDGDRIDILRPLAMDPKEARRLRARRRA
jgi:hypothetical protein